MPRGAVRIGALEPERQRLVDDAAPGPRLGHRRVGRRRPRCNWPRPSSCFPMARSSRGPAWCWCCRSSAAAATRRLLLRHALAHLAAQGRGAVLDATPAGHAVYVQEGFADTWGFARYRREAGVCWWAACRAAVPAACARTTGRRSMRWTAGLRCQPPGAAAHAWRSGCRRRRASWSTAADCAAMCWVATAARRCRSARCWPRTRTSRSALLHDALQPLLAQRSTWTCSTRQRELLPWLQQQGFAFQRPSRAWCTAPMPRRATRRRSCSPPAPNWADRHAYLVIFTERSRNSLV